MTSFRIFDATHIGYAHLRVPDIEHSLAFYRDLLGFRESFRNDTTVYLSAAAEKPYRIVLTEEHHARPMERRSPGLFHIAIRFPNRAELARMFKRIQEQGGRFQGFSDHGVSDALYLADADGNGIELYADKPRDRWQYENSGLTMYTKELDIDALLKELPENESAWKGIHNETDIGHIHLQVSSLTKAEKFYHEILGFDITQRNYPGALFVSAGGYHHHIGLNIWNSRGAAPAHHDALGILRFGVHIPENKNLEQLKERLNDNSYQFSETMLAGRNKKSILVRDLDEIEIEIYTE